MEKDVVNYVRHHTFQITVLIASAILILLLGELFLYRKTRELNSMVSEGLMQIKEEIKQKPQTLDDFIIEQEKKLEEND